MTTRNKLSRLSELVDTMPDALPGRRDRHVTAPAQLLAYSGELQEAIAERDRLRAQLEQAAGDREVPLDDLVFGPQHYLPVKADRVHELAEHLKSNALHNPILVRRLADGRIEVLAGRHRVAAFRELGRSAIPARFLNVEDREAESLVVFDNLLAPQLADFEVFLGLGKLKASRDLSFEELITLSGMSKAKVSRLFAFEDAPDAVQRILHGAPSAMTAYQAGEIRRRKLWGHARLAEGVQRVVDGQLRSTELLNWLTRERAPTSKSAQPELVVTAGHRRFATVRVDGSYVRVSLADSQLAERSAQAIARVLEEVAREQADQA